MYVLVAVVSVIYAASVAVPVDEAMDEAEMRQAAAFFKPNLAGKQNYNSIIN